jgi:hypothetical protein
MTRPYPLFKNIAYAIYLDADGTLDIYEQGNEKVSNFSGGFTENQPQPAVKLTQVKSLPSSATL